jgi:hypothetical protein
MSKKHFEWAAAYVRNLRTHAERWTTPAPDAASVAVIEDAFADLFTRFGARFDEPRFRAACQVPA